ncbi:MAG: trimethylamine methyltransferase, partial [Gammaproteobacteria bacterium]|nr:trimethylamine methyltransferase [Gammaproteobacteria bacterium]
RRAGARVEDDGLVKIPPALVEEAIEAAPEALTIFDRTGAEAMRLEGRNTYYGTGPTTPLVYDPYTGERRETDTPDIENAALICDALENIDFVMSMGISGGSDPAVHGIKPEMIDRFDFKAMLTHTTKPNVFLAYSLQGLIDIHDMAAAVVGGAHELQERPFVIHYSEPTSPLIHSSVPLEKLLFCADKAMPVIYVGGPLMGGTAPVTLAGQLVVSNAECLSGLVIHQLKAQGSPFIYGAGGNPLD